MKEGSSGWTGAARLGSSATGGHTIAGSKEKEYSLIFLIIHIGGWASGAYSPISESEPTSNTGDLDPNIRDVGIPVA